MKKDVILSLYSIPSRKMSGKCRVHFEIDTCFYECSPNLAPWIVKDTVSKVSRKEKLHNVPLCASDCDQWFEDRKVDYTCNDNWNNTWNWTNKCIPQMCTKQCKTFKEYLQGPKNFCQTIYDHSLSIQIILIGA